MPNWIKNKIIVGSKIKLKEIEESYTKKEDGVTEFDFNKVIPMPKELEIEFSSKSDDGLVLYLALINPNIKYFGEEKDKIDIFEFNKIKELLEGKILIFKNYNIEKEKIEKLIKKYNNNFDELIELGKIQIANIKKFNALNWYDWSINNWGSKWNCYNTVFDYESNILTFETPWDPAIPIFLNLTKQKNTRMALLYADEDIGVHTGYVLANNGKIDYKGKFNDLSIDAYKLAFDLWNCGDDYIFDNIKNTYVLKN